jgi:hypothetical protein
MMPSMSRPANPYDNASCESFLKTLKREEIYANRYRDLGHLRRNIEVFIEQYYNRCDSIQRWATVRRRNLSTRWHQSTHLPPRPYSFFSQQKALTLRE